jgi:hypothetical protein
VTQTIPITLDTPKKKKKWKKIKKEEDNFALKGDSFILKFHWPDVILA